MRRIAGFLRAEIEGAASKPVLSCSFITHDVGLVIRIEPSHEDLLRVHRLIAEHDYLDEHPMHD